MEELDALRLALSIYRQPLNKARFLAKPVPKGVLWVIKIAAGSEEASAKAAQELQESPQLLHDASVFYLQQVLARPKLDSHGLLCLTPGAAAADVALHKRWLLKWLHPDRNGNRWETVLFQRVLAAAEKIEQDSRQAVAPDTAIGKPPVAMPRQTRKHRSHLRKRPEPVFNWQLLIRRVLKSAVAVAVLLLVTDVATRLSSFSNGNGSIASLLGW